MTNHSNSQSNSQHNTKSQHSNSQHPSRRLEAKMFQNNEDLSMRSSSNDNSTNFNSHLQSNFEKYKKPDWKSSDSNNILAHEINFKLNIISNGISILQITEEEAATLLNRRLLPQITENNLTMLIPSNTRTDSSNPNPQAFWQRGLQICAVSHQTAGLMMDLNEAKFLQNRSSGYCLRPPGWNCVHTGLNGYVLKLEIISGIGLARPKNNDSKGYGIDPYVVVEMYGPGCGVPHFLDNQTIIPSYTNSSNLSTGISDDGSIPRLTVNGGKPSLRKHVKELPVIDGISIGSVAYCEQRRTKTVRNCGAANFVEESLNVSTNDADNDTDIDDINSMHDDQELGLESKLSQRKSKRNRTKDSENRETDSRFQSMDDHISNHQINDDHDENSNLDSSELNKNEISHPGTGFALFQHFMEFNVDHPESSILRFVVLDDEPIGDSFIGQFAIPVACIRPGYRWIPLRTLLAEPIPGASLFIRVSIQPYIDLVCETGDIFRPLLIKKNFGEVVTKSNVNYSDSGHYSATNSYVNRSTSRLSKLAGKASRFRSGSSNLDSENKSLFADSNSANSVEDSYVKRKKTKSLECIINDEMLNNDLLDSDEDSYANGNVPCRRISPIKNLDSPSLTRKKSTAESIIGISAMADNDNDESGINHSPFRRSITRSESEIDAVDGVYNKNKSRRSSIRTTKIEYEEYCATSGIKSKSAGNLNGETGNVGGNHASGMQRSASRLSRKGSRSSPNKSSMKKAKNLSPIKLQNEDPPEVVHKHKIEINSRTSTPTKEINEPKYNFTKKSTTRSKSSDHHVSPSRQKLENSKSVGNISSQNNPYKNKNLHRPDIKVEKDTNSTGTNNNSNENLSLPDRLLSTPTKNKERLTAFSFTNLNKMMGGRGKKDSKDKDRTNDTSSNNDSSDYLLGIHFLRRIFCLFQRPSVAYFDDRIFAANINLVNDRYFLNYATDGIKTLTPA